MFFLYFRLDGSPETMDVDSYRSGDSGGGSGGDRGDIGGDSRDMGGNT